MAAFPRSRLARLRGTTAIPSPSPIRATARGRKGKGSAPKVADDTARSKNVIRLMDLWGEGEIELVDGDKSIFFNGTPLRSETGVLNFEGVIWDTRPGTANQTWMEGNSAVENEVNAANVILDQNDPISFAISNTGLTAIRPTLYFPSFQKTTKKGAVVGTKATVVFEIEDSFGVKRSTTVNAAFKASRGYQRSTRLPLHGTGPWTFTATKTSINPTNLDNNEVRLSSYTEILDRKLRYPYSAYIRYQVDSELFGGQVPLRSSHVRGRPVRVPSNYNATTRVYTGVWDGTWQTARTKNPVWIWMDAATNKRLGAGLDDAYIDKWGLYAIAKYADGMVDDGYGGQEPRFQCDVVINSRQEAYAVLSVLSSSFRGMLYYGGGKVKVSADMPADPSFNVVPAKVEGGEITYADNDTSIRPTVFWVSYNDRASLGKQRIEVVEDPVAINKYGYNISTAQAFACWSRGQARRVGKWLLEELWSADESAKWVAGPDHAPRHPGAIGLIADRNDTLKDWGGLVRTLPSSTTVELDRPVTLESGKSYTLWLTNDDSTLSEHAVVSAAGTHTTLTVAAPIVTTVLTDSIWAMTQNDLAPRLFKAMVVDEPKTGKYAIEAVSYDPGKFDRVEQDLLFTPSTFVDLPSPQSRPLPPTDAAVHRETIQGAAGASEFIQLDWRPPVDKIARDFVVRYRLEDNEATTFTGISSPGLRLPYIPGDYVFEIFSVSIVGVWSAEPLVLEASIGVERSLDDATIESLRLANQDPSVNEFTGQVASFEWNVGKPSDWPDQSEGEWYDPFFASFEVTILKAADDTLLRTISTTERRFSYSFEHNKLDHGGTPERSFKVGVSFVGLDGSKTDPVYKTVTNPPPANLASLTATGTYMAVEVSCARPADTDFEGIKIWASTTSGFTPNDGTNLVYKGPDNRVRVPGLPGQTLYVRSAGYDKFGETGLNMGSQVSATVTGAEYIGDTASSVVLATLADAVADNAANADAIIAEAVRATAAEGVVQSQVTTLAAEVTTARGGKASLDARITDEASAAASATAAVATRTSTLETQAKFPKFLPERPTISANFTNALPTPASPATAPAANIGTAVAVANEGDVRQIASATAIFWTIGALPVLTGRTFRMTSRDRVSADGTSNLARTGYSVFDKDWNALAHVTSDASRNVASGWVTTTLEVTAATILASYSTAAYIRPVFRGGHNAGLTASGATWQLAFLRMEDITDLRVLSASVTAAEAAAVAGDVAVANTVTTLRAQFQRSDMPARFDDDGQYFTSGYTDNPLTVASANPTQGTFQTVAGKGRVWRTSATALHECVAHKGVLQVISGHDYSLTFEFRAVSDATNGQALKRLMGFQVFNAAGTSLGGHWAAINTAYLAASGWLTESFTITAASILAAYPTAAWIRPLFFKWSNVAASDGQVELVRLDAFDATVGTKAELAIHAGVIATLEGKTEAWWELALSTGIGVDAFMRARVEDGSAAVGLGADVIGLYNRLGGEWKTAVKIAGGDVTVLGNILAGGKVYIGSTGDKWELALQGKQFSVADGDTINYGVDLGVPPDFAFSEIGLAPKTASETYDLYADGATSTSAIVRLKIRTPGTPTTYSKGPTSIDTGSTPKFALSKGADPDANSNLYTFVASFSLQATMNSLHQSDPKRIVMQLGIYSKKSGVWTREGALTFVLVVSSSGTGLKTYTATGSGSMVLQSGPSDFGVHLEGAQLELQYGVSGDPPEWYPYASTNGAVTQLGSVQWVHTPSSGTRSATPSGEVGKVTVVPKNVQ